MFKKQSRALLKELAQGNIVTLLSSGAKHNNETINAFWFKGQGADEMKGTRNFYKSLRF